MTVGRRNIPIGIKIEEDIDVSMGIPWGGDVRMTKATTTEKMVYNMYTNPKKRGVAIGGFHFGGLDIDEVVTKLESNVFQNNGFQGSWNWRDIVGNFVTKAEVEKGYSMVMIENPKRIELTVSDDLHKKSYESGLEGEDMTAYQLAELHAAGPAITNMKTGKAYSLPERDVFEGMQDYAATPYFINQLKVFVEQNSNRSSERIGKRYGVKINWQNVADECADEMKAAMASNAFKFEDIAPITKQERINNGLSESPPMYTGKNDLKLADCIIGVVVDDYETQAQTVYEDEVPF